MGGSYQMLKSHQINILPMWHSRPLQQSCAELFADYGKDSENYETLNLCSIYFHASDENSQGKYMEKKLEESYHKALGL